MKVEEGDAILLKKLDRFNRKMADITSGLKNAPQGVAVPFIDDGGKLTVKWEKMVITILSAVAQAEPRRMVQRTH